jgi:integrase
LGLAGTRGHARRLATQPGSCSRHSIATTHSKSSCKNAVGVSLPDADSLLRWVFAHLNAEPYRTLCLVALKTGMRQGALLALRWGDVDLEQAVVRVRASYTGGALGTPKNRERRDVDLISDIVELLAPWREGQEGPVDELVFPGENGSGFLSPTVLLRRHLYPAMAAAEIRRVGPTQEKRTFHSFRHTFAKRALESGAQITWLSRHLGHSSLKVTTDIYGHWERAERKLQAARMEGAFPV